MKGPTGNRMQIGPITQNTATRGLGPNGKKFSDGAVMTMMTTSNESKTAYIRQ